MGGMRIAAIDMGSNSFHMVIVESVAGAFHLIEQEKEMVRLGERTLSRGRLSADAMRRGLDTLREFKRLADAQGVDKLLAAATSAVREATNGEDFLDQVGREIGVWPRVVSGQEEARLIYLAVLHSVHLEGQRALVVDIGGGSVELTLGTGERMEWAVSEKLGVLRMKERFVDSDPLSSRDERRLAGYVEELVAPHTERARTAGFDIVVGTSGTILALGAMAHAAENGSVPESLHHLTVPVSALHDLRKRLVASTLKGRRRLPAMDERRADIIVAGAVVLDTILQAVQAKQVVLCEWALREGLLIDYLQQHPRSVARAEAYPDVRRRSVVSLAEKCGYDEEHARQVARLALDLFDGTQGIHGLGARERGLLEFAALLHDVGRHISYPGRHKHTFYLIRNGDLRGFAPLDIEVLALVGRYHRQGTPRKKNAAFAALPGADRRAVRILAGLLRLADALDRSHRRVVKSLAVSGAGGVLRLRCEVEGDASLEQWAAGRRLELLARTLERPLRLEFVPPAAGPSAPAAAPSAAARPSAPARRRASRPEPPPQS
jgi:exopolyphosphatase / guanosine-5'-triphosphate,3'-diphosphate pyrophosphatase